MNIKKNLKQQGFTIAEVMIVVMILGVLAGLAIPSYTTQMERFRAREGVTLLMAIYDAQKAFEIRAGDGNFASNITQLDIDIPASKNFNVGSIVLGAAPDVASIDQSAGDYELSVDSNGQITCDDGVGSMCGKIGF